MSKLYKYLKLSEGGAFGHLANIFDNVYFTFGDLKDITKKTLSGDLEYVWIKTDGQNLMVSWIDGEIRFARNKSHLKNYGENSMTTSELASKFAGRGGLTDAFNNAAIDLGNAISNLTDKQRDKIFKNGKKFISIEVMYTESENIVHYGVNEIRFHGTNEYDIDGNVIDTNQEDGRILGGMIKQVKQDRQDTYQIKSLEKAQLPKIPDFDDQVKRINKEINRIRSRFRLSDSNTIQEYKDKYFIELMKDKGIPFKQELLDRWSKYNKKYTLRDVKNDYSPEDYKKIKEIEDNIKDYQKDCLLPLEKVILDLGATALNNLQNFMVINPDETIQRTRKRLESAIEDIRSRGTPKMIKKLHLELERLEAAGGVEKISPEEGITFMLGDQLYKLTGTFASLNQIINLTWQLE